MSTSVPVPTDQASARSVETSEDRIVDSIYDDIVSSICIDIASNVHKMVKTGDIPLSKFQEPVSRKQMFPALYKDKDESEIQEELEKYATYTPETFYRKRRVYSINATGSNKKQQLSRSPSPLPPSLQDKTGAVATEFVPSSSALSSMRNFPSSGSARNSPLPFQVASANTTGGAAVRSSSTGWDDNTRKSTNTAAVGSNNNNNNNNNNNKSLFDIWGKIPPKEPKQTCQCQICGRYVSALRFAPHLDKCMGLSSRPTSSNPSRSSTSSLSMSM